MNATKSSGTRRIITNDLFSLILLEVYNTIIPHLFLLRQENGPSRADYLIARNLCGSGYNGSVE
jgi:hypothetical protein